MKKRYWERLEVAFMRQLLHAQAAKAEFIKQKAQVESETAIIKAKGEAEAISVRGKAIRENPGVVELMMVEKWNGISPLVVGKGEGASIMLPIKP